MPPTKRETDTTELLEFLLNEVEADELTGLWALSYELSKKEHLDKTDTINLINKINDNLKNLKNLSAESLENTNDNIEQDQIEENIDEKTLVSLLKILKEKNPLFKIEEEIQQSPMSPTVHVSKLGSKPVLNQSTSWARRPIALQRQRQQQRITARGIKKSRRKKRKRTKRKRSKRKRTKRKRSKKTGGAALDGPMAQAAAALAAQSPPTPLPPPLPPRQQAEETQSSPPLPPRQIVPSIYQLRLNLRVGGYYVGNIKDWLHYYGGLPPIKAKDIADHMFQHNSAKTIKELTEIEETSLFKYIASWRVDKRKLSDFERAFKMLKLHSEGPGCRYNTGSIVRNLICDRKDEEEEEEDKFCLMGCPGPNFKEQGPIEGAMVLKNDETREIIDDFRNFLEGRLEQEDNYKISVIILEDEDYYKNTTELGLYDEIPEDNRIHIPCIDMQAHESIQYINFIKIIEQIRKQDHMIITHCFCGAGRTSSMIMCCKLYFLIDNILKTILKTTKKFPPYTLLNIPELFGIETDINNTPFGLLLEKLYRSPAGNWIITNYRSYSSRAKSQPGHEFLNVSKRWKLLLFIDRMNAISKALANYFEIPFFKVVNHTGIISTIRTTSLEDVKGLKRYNSRRFLPKDLNPLVIDINVKK